MFGQNFPRRQLHRCPLDTSTANINAEDFHGMSLEINVPRARSWFPMGSIKI
jgi:hypothetical protein